MRKITVIVSLIIIFLSCSKNIDDLGKAQNTNEVNSKSSKLFPNIIAIKKGNTGTNSLEVHILNGKNNFQNFILHTGTPLHEVETRNRQWEFLLGDYNNDGQSDVYAINKHATGSGTTEVHILNGAENFQSFLLHTGTVLHETGTDGRVDFLLGDYNKDGKDDLYLIKKSGTGSKTTEVHVLNGADNFQSYLLHTGTVLHETGINNSWDFLLGDFNNDGYKDVYALQKHKTGSGKTEVHILNGKNNFQNFLLQKATILHETGPAGQFDFMLGDYDNDRNLDIYAINKHATGSGTTEVHILNGRDWFQSYLLHQATILHEVGRKYWFSFLLDKSFTSKEQICRILRKAGYCFKAGTKISTDKGLVNIEDIKVGDLVLSKNEYTGEVDYKRVLGTFNKKAKKLIKMKINGEFFESTPGHRFWSIDKNSSTGGNWVEASKLGKKSQLLNSDNMIQSIKSISEVEVEKEITVYNFEVESWHSYFIGKNKILVHNNCIEDKIKALGNVIERVIKAITPDKEVETVRDLKITFKDDIAQKAVELAEKAGVKSEIAKVGIKKATEEALAITDMFTEPFNRVIDIAGHLEDYGKKKITGEEAIKRTTGIIVNNSIDTATKIIDFIPGGSKVKNAIKNKIAKLISNKLKEKITEMTECDKTGNDKDDKDDNYGPQGTSINENGTGPSDDPNGGAAEGDHGDGWGK